MSATNTIDLSGLSKQYSSRDLASHTKLKYRDIGQGAPEEHKSKDKKDLRKDLDERERSSKTTGNKRSSIEPSKEDKEKAAPKKPKSEF
jgi:protein CWC15